MTAETSPLRMRASRSASVPSTSLTFETEAKAPSSVADAGVPSRSAKPIVRSLFPPEKIDPNRITKISGKASVQNSAARSRVKLLMLATVRSSSACIDRSLVPQGPAGQIEEDVLEGRPADGEVRGLGPELVGRLEDRPDRRRDVTGVQEHIAVLV